MTSSEINAEIYNIAPIFFEEVRREVRQRATKAETVAEHMVNQERLDAAVAAVLAEALPQNLDHNQLWQVLWRRVAYAGTRASKASKEIESMNSLVPLFQNLANYDPKRYKFSKSEWQAFVDRWQARYSTSQQKKNWLSHSKNEPDWDPDREFANGDTTPEVLKILTKDQTTYPGLRFSALPPKVEKYMAVAKFLHDHLIKNNQLPLTYYLNGKVFSSKHLEGNAWVQEKLMLVEVRDRFKAQVGLLTALHTMMDLGLKTIKPDRVMTFLFSQLGWLQTLPKSLSKKRVMENYLRPDVVEEMTVRADVFAASLDRAGYQQAHRLLDIWLVKFGQMPEKEWGITTNLQDSNRHIRSVLDEVKSAVFATHFISANEAAVKWPTVEYLPVCIQNNEAMSSNESRKSMRPRRVIVMTRDAAGALFRKQWLEGHAEYPDIYPARVPGIPNHLKEQIIQKIERGLEPGEAFLTVLYPNKHV